jgi:hypothetical protein
MNNIPLTKGFFAIIDDDDYEELSKHRWYCSTYGYAVRSVSKFAGRRDLIYMHIQLLGREKGLEIDHINGNSLDNRRCNLRRVTHQQNVHNSKPQFGGSSTYKGVYWHNGAKKWVSRIQCNGKLKHIGCFTSEKEAAKAYNYVARACFGEYARLNILEEEN